MSCSWFWTGGGEDVENGVEGGFGLALAIEEEGVVDAVPGEVVEPALAVVEVPEGDAGDDVGVFDEDFEEAGVLFGLGFEDIGRAGIAIGIEFGQFFAVFAAVGPPAGARDDIDIELGNDDFEFEFAHGLEGGFDLGEGDAIDLVVALEADGVDGGVAGEERFKELDHAIAFAGELVVVIVVD